MSQILASRIFTANDQKSFAVLTGDFNPIHMDSLAARRTQAGAPIVHGVHSLLWLLDSIAARNPDLPAIGAMKVRFLRMIYVGDQIEAVITRKDAFALQAEVTVDGVVAVQLNLTFGPVSSIPALTPLYKTVIPHPKKPHDLSLEDMASRSGILAFASKPENMGRMFPYATRLLGTRRLAALGGSTLLVGMVIPGLYSIYSGLTLTFCDDTNANETIAFKVAAIDSRFRLVRLDIHGGGLSGSLETFSRQPPVAQATLQTVASLVASDEFANSTALIVGGSRGLGELTAKVIAAGGGKVIITYAVGKSEAEALTAEITAFGGSCQAILYDVHQDADRQLSSLIDAPTHIYYFATPPIFGGKSRLFSQSRLKSLTNSMLTVSTGWLKPLSGSVLKAPVSSIRHP